jgi:hypothetical protein
VIIYAETNFLLNLGLRQEEHLAAAEIVGLAKAGTVKLAIPAFSVFEAINKAHALKNRRRALSSDLGEELKQLKRSTPKPPIIGAFDTVIGQLTLSSGEILTEFQMTMIDVLKWARLIAFDAKTMDVAVGCQKTLGLSVQDSFVYATIIVDLSELEDEEARCFLSQDRAFIDAVREQLDGVDCKSFYNYRAALDFAKGANG